MNYKHERNYGCRISDEYTFRGLKTVVLENKKLRVTILADKGTDIFEFLYKPMDVDFFWHSPSELRNPALTVPTKASALGSFLDGFHGGMQLCLPNGGWPCTYKNAELGLHGEFSTIPWRWSIVEDDPERVEVKFRARGLRTPFYMERRFALTGDSAVLHINDRLLNEAEESMELMWGYHPSFGAPFLSEHCHIDIPAKTVEICSQTDPNARLIPAKVYNWPIVKDKNGNDIDLRKVPPPEIKTTDQAYMKDMEEGWFSITNQQLKVGFGMSFPKKIFPCVWYWQSFKGEMGYPLYGRAYVAALEPFTSYPRFGLEEAIERGVQMKMQPGETVEVDLKAIAYEGINEVGKITKEGQIVPRK